MAFKGLNDFNSALKANINAIEADFEAKVDEVVLNATVAAEREMVRTIDETESALSPGKPNRNWTFTMRASLDGKVQKRGRKRGLQAGWLRKKEKYFLVQDQGGTVNGREVWPMHALLNGYNTMRQEIETGMRRIVRERGK